MIERNKSGAVIWSDMEHRKSLNEEGNDAGWSKLCPRANIWYASHNKVLSCLTSGEVSTWQLWLSHRLINVYAVLLLQVGRVCGTCRSWWTPTWTTPWSWTSSSPTASRWIGSIRPLTLWKMGQGTSWYTCSSRLLVFNFLTDLSNNTQLKHVWEKHKSTNRFLDDKSILSHSHEFTDSAVVCGSSLQKYMHSFFCNI